MKLDFERIVEILKSLGVKFTQEEEWRSKKPPRKPHPLPIFKSILLPYTPEEWCRLMMNEGDQYIGGCCGTTSGIQDIISSTFRFQSGWMKVRDLADVAHLFVEHDESETLPNFGALGNLKRAIKKWPTAEPWTKMAILWHLVKDHYLPEAPRPETPREQSAVEAAALIVERGLGVLMFHRVFGHDRKGHELQHDADRLMTLYRVLPGLRTLWEKIGELAPPTLEGHALVRKDNHEVTSNGFGLCVFKHRIEAERLIELWRKDEAEREEKSEKLIDEIIEIRPVRISMEKGIEFLD